MTNVLANTDLRRQLLERIRNGELPASKRPRDPLIPPVFGEAIPLSCGQQQVWLHSEFAPDAPIYNESITIRKSGFLDPFVLETSFNEIVRRHAIWRTGFAERDGEVTQVVHPQIQVSLPLIDLSHLSPNAAAAKAVELAGEDGRCIFDLGKPPVLRARLIRVAPEDHRLYLTFHHLVFDGVSIYRVFLPELASVYNSYLLGRPSPLADLRIQYGDYAAWQQKKVSNGDYAQQLNYWRDTLKIDAPPVKLPVNQARSDIPRWRAGMETFALPEALSKRVKHLAASQGASLYMTLLAAFHVLLYRYSGQEEIATGAVVSTRNRSEIEPLIGFLLNTLVLSSHIDPSLSFREFLHQMRNTVLNALANSDVPFDTVVRQLAPKRDSGRNALFQILFSLRPASTDFPNGWELTELDVHSGASGFDLFVDIVERPAALMGRIVYSSALFEQSTIARMIGHLQTLLEAIVDNPDVPVSVLPLMTGDERKSILAAGSGPSISLPATTIGALLEETASRYPKRTAVVFEGQELTFQELDRRANSFAAELREAGARPGALVSISVERSLALVVALVGTLKTGAAYLPVDPSLPQDRRDFILGHARPHLQITSTELTISRNHREVHGDRIGLAYVLYTSGSTGVPKGVEVPHTAVVNFLRSMQREPGFSSSDILLAVTTLSFDIAALEIFLPLVSGGTLVIAPRQTVTDPQRLIQAMRDSKCTVMQGTPAMWRSLIDFDWKETSDAGEGANRLKILCGGEALSRDLANRLLPRCRELWNMYGPTETTIWSTVHRVEPGDDSVSIGHSIDNTQVYVLDRQLQLLPTGITGELYIGGSGVAEGYIGEQALTTERFLSSPFIPGQRIYRTGDLARLGASGSLEFLGRADDQVKIRGYRVELQEIEEALIRYPGVRSAAVKAWRDASGENTLAAYLVGTIEVRELRSYLARKIPDYMIPSRFIELPSIPLTPNGKLDRKSLPDPGQKAHPSATRTSNVPRSLPRNEIEHRVTALWAELLDTPNPDTDQNFFDLGGHSLLAVTMLRRIGIEFGKRLSISALFENPTIAGLSTLLLSDERGDSEVSSGAQYLHWMYAGAYIRHLASHLRPEHRLHGVSLPEKVENSISSSDRLEDVARLIIDEMRSHSIQGPYNIAGWCISGILAYEVAAQLKALGEEIGLVALVGAPNPQHYTAIPKHDRLKSKLKHHWNHVRRLDAAGIPGYLLALARYQAKERNPLQSRSFERILLELALRYKPKPLNARVVLFQGADRPSVVDYSAGWTGLVNGEFSAYDVPGNHVTSLEEQNVGVLAQKLKSCLR